MFAGLENSQDVDAVIILDGDLQHPPELIPQMIEKYMENDTDQVIAKRNRDGEKASRKLMTKCYYKLINRFVDVPIEDGVGDFRLLSQRAVRSLVELDEVQRFSKGLFHGLVTRLKRLNITIKNVRLEIRSGLSLNY